MMTTATDELVLPSPFGGNLINLLCADEERNELASYANSLQTLQLSDRLLCDLELLSVGAFSPLDRFMSQADYLNVVQQMRLTTGQVFRFPSHFPLRPTNGRSGATWRAQKLYRN